MIDYVTTPAATSGNAKVYDGEKAFHYDAISNAPDFATLIDSFEDRIRQELADGGNIDFKDLAINFLNQSKRELLAELLVKLLALLRDSTDIRLDLEILLSCTDLKLSDEPDSAIAQRHGILRQTYSARKRALLVKLNLPPPAHSKSETACKTYQLTNRKNGTIN